MLPTRRPFIVALKWLKPLYPGYILEVRTFVGQCIWSDVGLIYVNYKIVNQHNMTLMTLESNAFFRCKKHQR
jgi:acyl dehydratase